MLTRLVVEARFFGDTLAVALGHIERAVTEVSEVVSQLGIEEHEEALDVVVGVATSMDVAH